MADSAKEFLSAYWHDLNLDADDDCIAPREKVDGYRKILFFLERLKQR